MKINFEKALKCQNKIPSNNPEIVYKSVACLNTSFSDKLSSMEQAGLSAWLLSIKKVNRIWKCSVKKYQIKSYHAYTPHFICIDIVDSNNAEEIKLIFFEKTNNNFKISSVYTPFKW